MAFTLRDLMKKLQGGVDAIRKPLPPPVVIKPTQKQLAIPRVQQAYQQSQPLIQQAQQTFQQAKPLNVIRNAPAELPRLNFADKYKNPVSKFVATIPQELLNAPRDVFAGSLGLGANVADIAYGKTPVNPLRNIGALGTGMLNAYVPTPVKNIATQAGKTALKGLVKKGAIQGAKLGALGGSFYGMQEGDNVKEQLQNALKQGAIGAGVGAVAGGTIPAIAEAWKKGKISAGMSIKDVGNDRKTLEGFQQQVRKQFIKEQGFEPTSMDAVDAWYKAKQVEPFIGTGGHAPENFQHFPLVSELPKNSPDLSRYQFTKDGKIVMYRGIPKGVKTRGIRYGDFVSADKMKAAQYGKVERFELDPSKVRALGDLEAVYFDEAKKLSAPVPKSIEDAWKQSTNPSAGMGVKNVGDSPLHQEARKYKSAEEFVKAQGTPLLHGTEKQFKEFDIAKRGMNEKDIPARESFFFTDSLDTAKSYGKNIQERYGNFKKPLTLDADGKMYGDMREELRDAVLKAKEEGNDVVIIKNLSDRKDWGNYEPATHYAVLDVNTLKTKSQLTDIWKKANEPRDNQGGFIDFGEIGNSLKKTFGISDRPPRKALDPDNALQDQVVEEMIQSMPGQRFFTEQANSMSPNVTGMKSTFPKWVPSDLRSTKLFNQVSMDLYEGKAPRVGTKRAELYEIAQNEINKRLQLPTDYSVQTEAQMRQALKPKPQVVSRPVSFNTPYNPLPNTGKLQAQAPQAKIQQPKGIVAQQPPIGSANLDLPKTAQSGSLPPKVPNTKVVGNDDAKVAYQDWVNARHATKVEGFLKNKEFAKLDAQGIKGYFKVQAGETKGIFGKVRKYFDAKYNELQKAGVDFNYQRDYLPQQWDNSEAEIAQVFGRSLGKRPSFTLEKVIKDYQTGISAGLKPKFQTVGQLTGWYEEKANKAIADTKFFNYLAEGKMIMPSTKAPSEWVTIDPDRFPKVKFSIGDTKYVGTYKAPKEIADNINNYLRDANFKLLENVANYVSRVKNIALNFGVPGTAINSHGVNILARHTLFGTGQNPITRFLTGAKYMVYPNSAMKYLDTELLKAPSAVKNGLTMSAEDYTGIGKQAENLAGQFSKKWEDVFSTPLFNKMLPALKLSSYEALEKTGMDPKDVAKLINNVYGGINWEQMGRNRDTQNLLRSIILAPDWAETTLRVGGNFAKALNPLQKGQVMNKYRVMMATFLGSYVALNVTNKLTSGHYAYENAPGHTFELESGQTADGATRYIRPYGTAMDMVRLPYDIAKGLVKGDVSVLARTIRNRLSIPAGVALGAFTDTDYRGNAIGYRGKDRFGNEMPIESRIANIGSEAASLVGFPSFLKQAGATLTGQQGLEQGITQGLELPFRYSYPQKKLVPKLTVSKDGKVKVKGEPAPGLIQKMFPPKPIDYQAEIQQTKALYKSGEISKETARERIRQANIRDKVQKANAKPDAQQKLAPLYAKELKKKAISDIKRVQKDYELTESEKKAKIQKIKEAYQKAVGSQKQSLAPGKRTAVNILPALGPITGIDGSSLWKHGLDVDLQIGTPVPAAVGGQVIASGYNGGFGNQVKIQGDDGREYWYSHLSKRIAPGKRIEAGQIIGLGGNTGNVIPGKGGDGSHLDLTVLQNGRYMPARSVAALLKTYS